jgi:hypothetical protein
MQMDVVHTQTQSQRPISHLFKLTLLLFFRSLSTQQREQFCSSISPCVAAARFFFSVCEVEIVVFVLSGRNLCFLNALSMERFGMDDDDDGGGKG